VTGTALPIVSSCPCDLVVHADAVRVEIAGRTLAHLDRHDLEDALRVTGLDEHCLAVYLRDSHAQPAGCCHLWHRADPLGEAGVDSSGDPAAGVQNDVAGEPPIDRAVDRGLHR
jgi:hypothetical protein